MSGQQGRPAFCAHCGAALEPGVRFCASCGEAVDDAGSKPGPERVQAAAMPARRAAPDGASGTSSMPPPRRETREPRRSGSTSARVYGRNGDAAAQIEPLATENGRYSASRVIVAAVANVVTMAVLWGAGWGLGALLTFHELGRPAETFGEIAQNGFSTDDIDFAINSAGMGVVGGAIAGMLLAFPFAGVFAPRFSVIVLTLLGWGATSALTRHAAILFNMYLPEHVASYFGVCGLVAGLVTGAILAREKAGGTAFRVLASAAIWAAVAFLLRLGMYEAIGL